MLNALPAPVTSALRGLRTLGLRSLGPLDWLSRRLTGRPHLPPLWLRRHVGDPRAFESSARELLAFLAERGLLAANGVWLDIGCGCGALELPLRSALAADARVVGFDVHAPSIRWARRAFREDPRFAFHLACVRSPYGSTGETPAESYAFPLGDSAADLVVAKSVFTHLLAPEARHYLAETRRVLRPGGHAVVTAFLFDRGSGTPVFPFTAGEGSVRWRVRRHPRAAVSYERGLFESMLREARLDVREFVPGFWPGDGASLTGQDTFVLAPVAARPA